MEVVCVRLSWWWCCSARWSSFIAGLRLGGGMIRVPEELILTVCEWTNFHTDDKSHLVIGGKPFHIVSFQFNDWVFPECSVGFFMEFTSFFPDRVLEIVYHCPQCEKRVRDMVNSAIIEACGIPPIEA